MNNILENYIGKKINMLTITGITKRELNDGNNKIKRRYLFECRCECGKSTIIWPQKLLKGKTKSCGCYTIESTKERNKNLRLEYGESSKRSLIRSYKSNARKKGYAFNLTDEQCEHLFKQNCHYCNLIPSTIKHKSEPTFGEYVYNGIDRMNNNIGYESDNVVTCCQECNFKKGAQSYEDFIKWINRLVQNANK